MSGSFTLTWEECFLDLGIHKMCLKVIVFVQTVKYLPIIET